MKYKDIKLKCVILSLLIAVISIFSGCGKSPASPPQPIQPPTRDISKPAEEPKKILLSDDGISYDGAGITINGGTVEISDGGVYSISGALSNGQIFVDTHRDVVLELNGIDITCDKSSAVVFTGGGDAAVELIAGTVNRLADGTEKVKKKDTDGDTNATLYCNSSVEIFGDGELHITGNNRGGIYSGSKLEIYSGKFYISAKNQGIFAQSRLTVNGGEITIDKSKEGMECKGELAINGGNIKITSKDDALNAGEYLVVNGGYIYADCEGDGFDTNGDMTINGGEIYIFAGNKDNSPLDVSDGKQIGKFYINGGTVIAVGGDMKIAVEKQSKQSYSWIYPQMEDGGTVRVVADSGEEILSFDMPKAGDLMFISSDKTEKGMGYKLIPAD